MFGWGTALTLPSAASEPEKEREPPAHPTPLDFPECQLPDVARDQNDNTLHELHGLLANIKRPQDISLDRFKPLNLTVDNDVDVSQMFPPAQAQSLPPKPWEPEPEPPAGEERPRPEMSNGLPYPPKDRYEVLQNELSLDNDDVFREVARLPAREGRDRVRITQTRKFWSSLERMSQYWDNSIDNYFERPASPVSTSQGPDDVAHDDKMQTDERSSSTDTKMDVDHLEAEKTPAPNSNGEESERPLVQVYTGRRVGSGVEMPDEVREETVRSFVEMAAWPFGCQVTVPTLPPRLTVGSLLFPVRQSFQAARSPRDRSIARNGILEGPVLIGQCRPETGFRTDYEAPGEGIGEVCDLFREVGGMLLAAQERAREGATEMRPGEGKWWTTAPRFGGAPNDGILDDLMKGPGIHGIPIPESMIDGGLGSSAQDLDGGRKRRQYEHPFVASLARRPSAMRKLTGTEKWKIIQPGPSLWDKRMRYMQIGKDKESPFDDIYMISSINHHIAILHLRVHRRYLDILTHGESSFPEDSEPGQPWHVLKLQRTRWYDLLDAGDRIKALKDVWSLFHYQQRKA